MEANANLLQYYVHKMMHPRNPSTDQPQKLPPSKFRSKLTRSYLIHQYNFMRKITSQGVTQRPTQQLLLTKNNYKHYKRSMREQQQHKATMRKLQQMKRVKLSQLTFPNENNLTVSAIRMETPVRDGERMMRFTLVNLSPQGMGERERGEDKEAGMKRKLRTLVGLEVKRKEIQRSRDLEMSQQFSSERPEQEIEARARVISQDLVRTKNKGFELRTIPNLREESLDTVFEERARNYRQFLFIVYLGCGAYKDLQLCSQKFERKKDVKYQFYVGKGNNSNLIKSIMKKRWWWVLSSQITPQTKFVWTQRKVPSVFQRQLPCQQYQPILKPKKQDSLEIQIENQEQLLRLLHPQDVSLYKSYAKRLKKQPYSLASRLKYFGKDDMRPILQEPTIHNHFQGNNNIGNKKALLKNLTNWYKFTKRSPDTYNIPHTYHVKSQQDRDFQQFHTYFKQRDNKSRQGNVWIIKPAQNSNRGQGIKVSRNLKTIAGMLQNKKHTYVLQQYLTDLFLYNKRKFDIRTYILVTRLAGVMKVYWYQEGYIRTSSELYSLEDLSNPMIHLTNDAIQKYGENYGRYEPGNKISYIELQRYLDTNHSGKGYTVAKLVANMKSIATQAINACYLRLDPNCRYSNFQIFGLDFIIDSNFKPWLLQVNTNPCLQLSSPLLVRIIPRMVENAFKIGLDPVYPPTPCPYTSKPYLTDSVLDKNHFELVFDSQYDRDVQYERVFPTDDCKYEDDDELFDNEGQIVNVED